MILYFPRLSCVRDWGDDPKVVSESNAILKSLRKASALLTNLQNSLQETISSLENTLLPLAFGKGVANLSDDILSLIFESVYTLYAKDEENNYPHLNLSLVCRRFRDIVLNNPRLWNFISRNLEMNTVSLFLEKSKAAAGLELELKLCDESYLEEPGLLRPLLMTLPYCGKWQHLSLIIGRVEQDKITKDILESLTFVHPDRLLSLSIQYVCDEQHPLRHFYKSWDLSKLRSFRIVNVVPEPFPAPHLTSFTACFEDNNFDAGNLLRFLSANPALEAIALHFSDAGDSDPPTLEEIILENVRTLELNLRDTILDGLLPFRKALCTPNVKEISLKCLGHCSDDDEPELDERGPRNIGSQYYVGSHNYHWVHGPWSGQGGGLGHDGGSEHNSGSEQDDGSYQDDEPIDSTAHLNFALCHKSYPHLESLSYEHEYSEEAYYTYTLPFHKTPSLRRLKLHTPDSCPNARGVVPPLHELLVLLSENAGWGLYNWMKSLHKHMVEQHSLHRLEAVTIRHTGYFEQINNVFGTDKTVWDGVWQDGECAKVSESHIRFKSLV